MYGSLVSGKSESSERSFPQITERLEQMAHALKAITDRNVRRNMLVEMRQLLAEADDKAADPQDRSRPPH
jgi:hypothetical protein